MAKLQPADIHKVVDATQASQDRAELCTLAYIINEIDPRVIVEIGCHNGRSLQVWYDLWRPDVLIGVEIEPTDELITRSLDMLGCRLVLGNSVHEKSVNAVRGFLGDAQVDFLFIDGSHYYYDVKRDLENYGAMVRPGGIIAIDDASIRDNPTVEVYRLLEEIGDFQIIKASTGTGMAYRVES